MDGVTDSHVQKEKPANAAGLSSRSNVLYFILLQSEFGHST